MNTKRIFSFALLFFMHATSTSAQNVAGIGFFEGTCRIEGQGLGPKVSSNLGVGGRPLSRLEISPESQTLAKDIHEMVEITPKPILRLNYMGESLHGNAVLLGFSEKQFKLASITYIFRETTDSDAPAFREAGGWKKDILTENGVLPLYKSFDNSSETERYKNLLKVVQSGTGLTLYLVADQTRPIGIFRFSAATINAAIEVAYEQIKGLQSLWQSDECDRPRSNEELMVQQVVNKEWLQICKRALPEVNQYRNRAGFGKNGLGLFGEEVCGAAESKYRTIAKRIMWLDFAKTFPERSDIYTKRLPSQ